MSSFQYQNPGKSVGLQFWQLHSKWQRKIAKALSPYKITHTQFVILSTIKWYQEQALHPSQAEITKITNIEKMTLSKAIARLESQLLLKRTANMNDTRSVKISLTKKTVKLLPELISVVEEIDNEVFLIKNKSNRDIFANILVELNGKS